MDTKPLFEAVLGDLDEVVPLDPAANPWDLASTTMVCSTSLPRPFAGLAGAVTAPPGVPSWVPQGIAREQLERIVAALLRTMSPEQLAQVRDELQGEAALAALGKDADG